MLKMDDVGLSCLMLMMVEKVLQSLMLELDGVGLPCLMLVMVEKSFKALHLAYLRFGGRGQED